MDEKLALKEKILDKYIFCGLTNLNTGFDVSSIKYFSEKEFEILLQRVKELSFGIHGIEPWQDGKLYDVVTCMERSVDPANANPADSAWYMSAFEEFQNRKEKNLKYAATYFVPHSFFKADT